jgi:hypothetical protein
MQSRLGTGKHEAVLVECGTIAEPAATWLRTEKQKYRPDGLLLNLTVIVLLDRFGLCFAVQFDDPRAEINADVCRRLNPFDQIVGHARAEPVCWLAA